MSLDTCQLKCLVFCLLLELPVECLPFRLPLDWQLKCLPFRPLIYLLTAGPP